MSDSISSRFTSALVLCLLYLVSGLVVYYALNATPRYPNLFQSAQLWFFFLLAPIMLKYAVQLATLPWYGFIEKRREIRGTKVSAKVSVIVPAWNEEVGIIKTLASVSGSDYPDFEVIVVNDGSTDGTHRLVTDYIAGRSQQDTLLVPIKYLHLKNGGKARALNKGLAQASGEIVVTIDADSMVDKDAISNMIRRFTDEKVAAVAGNIVVGNRRKPIEIMQQLEYLYGFFFKRVDSCFNSVYIVGGAAAAYRKQVLLELGGFDHEIITEDVEMSTRILAKGYKSRYAADATVYTECPNKLGGLCNQRLRWKFGKLLTFIKHRQLFFSGSKKHNPYLCWFLLPVAIYGEFCLLIEGILLSVFYGIAIYTQHFLPILLLMGFISSVVSIQVLFDKRSRYHANLLLLAPVAWLVFYLVDLVEFQALYRSLKRLFRRENLQWQSWSRVGLLNKSLPMASESASQD